MSNSTKMSLEEKLVQQIKETTLGSLIDDEDSITTLTKRAITEALFTERRETTPPTSTYGSSNTKYVPSPVQQAAYDVVSVVINSLMADLIAKILSDPQTVEKINQAILHLLPSAILRNLDQQVVNNHRSAQQEVLNKLMTIFSITGDHASMNALQSAANHTTVHPLNLTPSNS